MPPGSIVNVYDVIADPPLFTGGTQCRLTCRSPGFATTFVGAPGSVAAPVGVAAFDGADGALVPMSLVAVTVNVYAVPLVSPLTVAEVAGGYAVTDCPPGDAVTVYVPIALAPSLAGAVHDTNAFCSPGVAVAAVGGSGTVARSRLGVTVFDGADSRLVPALFVAETVNAYV